MAAQYFSVVTLQGQAQIAAALSGQGGVTLAQLAAGDGNGAPTTPVVNQTALVREVWRGAIESVGRDPAAPTQVVVRATIPGSAGPATIRELGIYASNGELVAVANYPATDLAAVGAGAVTDITVDFVFLVDTSAPVTVQINSSSFVPVAQMMRAPFIAIDSFAVAPPATPAAGALVVIGTPLPHDANTPAPTGVFAGHANEFGQWTGVAWLTCAAPLATIVGTPDGNYWRRTADGWVEWLASANAPGLVRLSDLGAAVVYAGVDTTGTANAHVIGRSGSLPVPAALVDGIIISYVAASANTGPVTANDFGFGVKSVVDWMGNALTGGEYVEGRPTARRYNATLGKWQLLPWAAVERAALRLFKGTKAANQTGISNGVYTAVSFSAPACDFGTWNGTQLTITKAGTYIVSLNLGCYITLAAASYIDIIGRILVNGSFLTAGRCEWVTQTSGTFTGSPSTSAPIGLVAGDVITAQAYVAAATGFSSAYVSASSLFAIARVSQ